MKDRIPQYPGRVKLLHVKDDLYDLTRADEAVEQGTPLNKSTLLTDETATALGLDPDNNPTVNDALLQTLVNLAAVEEQIPSDAEIQKLISSGVTTHNQSAAAHSDIRSAITAVDGKIPSNTTIQQMINSGVSSHNGSTAAHSDIRTSITNVQSALLSINTTIANMTKCEFGSYVGTGIYGTSDDKLSTLTFQFAPTILILWFLGNTWNNFYFISPKRYPKETEYYLNMIAYSYNTNYKIWTTWSNDGKTIKWGSTRDASVQLNSNGETFFYFALA